MDVYRLLGIAEDCQKFSNNLKKEALLDYESARFRVATLCSRNLSKTNAISPYLLRTSCSSTLFKRLKLAQVQRRLLITQVQPPFVHTVVFENSYEYETRVSLCQPFSACAFHYIMNAKKRKITFQVFSWDNITMLDFCGHSEIYCNATIWIIKTFRLTYA